MSRCTFGTRGSSVTGRGPCASARRTSASASSSAVADAEAGELPLLLSLEVLNLATWVGVALIIAAWVIPTANNWGPFAALWQAALAPVTSRVERIGGGELVHLGHMVFGRGHAVNERAIVAEQKQARRVLVQSTHGLHTLQTGARGPLSERCGQQ